MTDYAAMGKSEQRALVESIVKIANLRACTQMVITPRPLVQQHQRKLTLTALSSSYTHDSSIAVWKLSTSTAVWSCIVHHLCMVRGLPQFIDALV